MRFGAALGAAAALVACGISRLPTPPYSQQQTSAYAEVAYPPPPARAETVPNAPQRGAVWIDGEWTWEGQKWAWKRGRWLIPPPGATFSPWAIARDVTGVLYVAEGTWRDATGHDIEAPAPLVQGRPNGGAVVNSEGEAIPLAPAVHDERTDAGAPADGST